MYELSWVLNSVNGKLLSKSEGVTFSGISTDSRRIMKDELFFALLGDNFDGHNFVQEAFDKGAAGAVVEEAADLLTARVRQSR